MNILKRTYPFFLALLLAGCGGGTKVISSEVRGLVSVGWSDNRHFAYILEHSRLGESSFELHTVELSRDGKGEIIADSLITRDIEKPYAPIAYDHKKGLIFFPDGQDIMAWDIGEKKMKPFSVNLPIEDKIERLFANGENCLVFALASQYDHKYMGKGFWWLVLEDTRNGEIVYSTDNAWRGGGFFLEPSAPVMHAVIIDTLTSPVDTIAQQVDILSRRTSPSPYTVEEIKNKYRHESWSPDLAFFVEWTENGISMERSEAH